MSRFVRKLTFDPLSNCSNWIKSEFSNKSRHVTIKFEEKLGWIKSETACICFTWLPPSHSKLDQKLDPRVSRLLSKSNLRISRYRTWILSWIYLPKLLALFQWTSISWIYMSRWHSFRYNLPRMCQYWIWPLSWRRSRRLFIWSADISRVSIPSNMFYSW